MSVVEEPRPSIVRVDSWATMQNMYSLLRKQDWSGLAKVTGREVEGYRSVVIDSGTELEYILRRLVVQESSAEVPEQQHYLRTQIRFSSLYRAFRDLPMSFVMVAGVRDLKDDISGIVRHAPEFQPALSKDLVRMTDLVLFQNVAVRDKKWVHTLQTHLSQRVVARDRSQRLDSIIEAEKLYFGDIVEKVLL